MAWGSRLGQALGYVRKLGSALGTARRVGSAVNRELGGALTRHPLGAKINELSKTAIQGTNMLQS
eukprot:528025-Hanusia_phi.AAC.1